MQKVSDEKGKGGKGQGSISGRPVVPLMTALIYLEQRKSRITLYMKIGYFNLETEQRSGELHLIN